MTKIFQGLGYWIVYLVVDSYSFSESIMLNHHIPGVEVNYVKIFKKKYQFIHSLKKGIDHSLLLWQDCISKGNFIFKT